MSGEFSPEQKHPKALISAANIPNLLSLLRIISAPLLLVLAYQYQRDYYAWLITGALISDILDGAIARRFGFVSRLGMLLDSIADLLIFFAAVYGLWRLFPEVVHDHSYAFSIAVLVWIGTDFMGFLRYGRLAAFHTYMSRVTAYIVGVFFVALFLWGFHSWLFWIAISFVVASHLEILVLLALLPSWSPDTPGIYWVLKARRAK